MISDYRKLIFFAKSRKIIFFHKNRRNITRKTKILRQYDFLWWRWIDDNIIWDKSKEGKEYWFKEQLYLAYFGLLLSKDKLTFENIKEYIKFLMCRYNTSFDCLLIKEDFINLCKKTQILNNKIIGEWEEMIN